MFNIRDAFEALVQAEQMGDGELAKVIETGTFDKSGAAQQSTPQQRQTSGTNAASPAQQQQHKQLVEECARLREQLALTQQQLAKAASTLASKKGEQEKFTLRNRKRASEGPRLKLKDRRDSKGEKTPKGGDDASKSDKSLTSSRRSSGGETPLSPDGSEDSSEFVGQLLITTTKQLENERSRAIQFQEECIRLRTQVENKLDERLNEMARRLNRANQSNEQRYKTMAAENESMKVQVASAKKAFMRKIEDSELAAKDKTKAFEERVAKMAQQMEALQQEVDDARLLQNENAVLKGQLQQRQAEVESLKADVQAKSELLQRSATALSAIKASIDTLNAEKAELQQSHRSEVAALKEENARLAAEVESLKRSGSGSSSGKLGVRPRANDVQDSPASPPVVSPRSDDIPPAPPAPSLSGSESSIKVLRRGRSESISQRGAPSTPEFPLSPRIDDSWRMWVTDPYVYDTWTIFQNCVDERKPEPLILQVKGHAWEVGMASVPPLSDPAHREYVEPLERVPYYQKNLLHREHVHFVGASASGEHLVVTVEAANEENRAVPLLALVHTKKSTIRAVVDMDRSTPLPPKLVHLDEWLNSTYPDCNLKRVDDQAAHELISQRLIEFENMHLDLNRRVGILYWKSGQSENAAFANNMTPELDEFLNFFGQRIRLKGWSKFRGGLNVKNDETGEYSVYAEYQEYSFMAHVSALLPFRESDEQKLDRKRHIGNDLVVIIFWEGPGSFDASQLVTQMCHVFIVIERVPSREGCDLPRYRIGVVCRSGVQPFKPYLPAPAEFDADDNLRSWLFMKIINGERSTFQARTFLTKTSTARKVLLDKLAREILSENTELASLESPFHYTKMVVREPVSRCKAIAVHAASSSRHLGFKKGDQIVLFCKLSPDIWNGGIGSKRGDFPSKCVSLLERKEKRKWGGGGKKSASENKALTSTIPFSHEVTFTIVKGVNLAAKDPSGTSDPYVKCWVISGSGLLEDSTRQTQKIMKTLNPEWNETFTLKISDRNWETFHFEVWDWDLVGSDDFMGEAEISVGEALDSVSTGQPFELPLEPLSNSKPEDGIVSGSIFVQVLKVVELRPHMVPRSTTVIDSGGDDGETSSGVTGTTTPLIKNDNSNKNDNNNNNNNNSSSNHPAVSQSVPNLAKSSSGSAFNSPAFGRSATASVPSSGASEGVKDRVAKFSSPGASPSNSQSGSVGPFRKR